MLRLRCYFILNSFEDPPSEMEGEEEELIIENEYESGVEMDEDEMKEVNFIVQSETGK